MSEIIPNQNGLPPIKADKTQYTAEEKSLLVIKAAELGIHNVAKAYGISWHTIVSWSKYYGSTSTTTKKAGSKQQSTDKLAQPQIIIQSSSGQEITTTEIIAKIGQVDKIYVRTDENKAYWVREQETGAIDLW